MLMVVNFERATDAFYSTLLRGGGGGEDKTLTRFYIAKR